MASALYATGPGPGAYGLPSLVGYEKHDLRKLRLPQYSFGAKNTLKSVTVGPGPGAYVMNESTRYGAKYSPAYSLGRKSQLKSNDFIPGPGTYAVHSAPIFKGPRSPAYTMGQRTLSNQRQLTPGPNQYMINLNFVKPKMPAFSLGLRTPIPGSKSQSPGPAAYRATESCKMSRCPPAYTIASRHGELRSKGLLPGPNCYNLQGYRPGRKGPQFSFGVKHSPYVPPLITECDN